MDNVIMSELITDDGSAPSAEFMFTYLHRELWRAEQSITQLRSNRSTTEDVAGFVEETGIESAAQFPGLSPARQQAFGSKVLETYFQNQDKERRLQACLESANKDRREIAALAESLAGKPLVIKALSNQEAPIEVIAGDLWGDFTLRDNIDQATASLADPYQFGSPILASNDLINFRPVSTFQRLRGITYRARLLDQSGEPLVSLSLAQ